MATASHRANLGFESDLWRAADALRSNMDAAEYKHVVLGLIFLKYISDAFEEQHAQLAIERDNPSLKGVLPKDYAHQRLDKHRLGELIDVIGTIGLGAAENRSKDILGRVYEDFLTQFASAEGKKGGEFYTPRSVVRVLVEMLAPCKGRVYNRCCGSAAIVRSLRMNVVFE